MACEIIPADTLCPAIYQRVVSEIQANFAASLAWLDKAYPLADTGLRNEGEKRIRYPRVMISKDEYRDLFPGPENGGSYCFFRVQGSPRQNVREFTTSYALKAIFWIDQSTFSAVEGDHTHALLQQIFYLNEQQFGRFIIDVQTEIEKDKVWTDYDYDYEHLRLVEWPYTTFSVTFNVSIDSDISCFDCNNFEVQPVEFPTSNCEDCPPGADGKNAAALIEIEPAGVNCEFGGVKITVGQDTDDNGVPDANLTFEYLCNPEPAADGASAYEVAVENGFIGTEAEWLASLEGEDGDDSTVPGPAGKPAVVKTEIEPIGPNCPYGGVKITSGTDTDDDGEPDEDLVVTYLCRLAPATDGDNGISSAIKLEDEPIGPGYPAGGVRITTGQDLDNNGIPETNTTVKVIKHGVDSADFESIDFDCLVKIASENSPIINTNTSGAPVVLATFLVDKNILPIGFFEVYEFTGCEALVQTADGRIYLQANGVFVDFLRLNRNDNLGELVNYSYSVKVHRVTEESINLTISHYKYREDDNASDNVIIGSNKVNFAGDTITIDLVSIVADIINPNIEGGWRKVATSPNVQAFGMLRVGDNIVTCGLGGILTSTDVGETFVITSPKSMTILNINKDCIADNGTDREITLAGFLQIYTPVFIYSINDGLLWIDLTPQLIGIGYDFTGSMLLGCVSFYDDNDDKITLAALKEYQPDPTPENPQQKVYVASHVVRLVNNVYSSHYTLSGVLSSLGNNPISYSEQNGVIITYGNGSGIYVQSTDDGLSFSNVAVSGFGTPGCVKQDEFGNIYFFESSGSIEIHRSTNGGGSFSTIVLPHGIFGGLNVISPTKSYIVTSEGVMITEDNFATFTFYDLDPTTTENLLAVLAYDNAGTVLVIGNNLYKTTTDFEGTGIVNSYIELSSWFAFAQRNISGLINITQEGLSAYQVAVNNGFVGTEAEWLASLEGTDGTDGEGYKTTYTGRTNLAGTSTYTVLPNLAYTPGARIRAASSALNYEEGVVTSYSGTTLVAAIDLTEGIPTAAGNLNLAGDVGTPGSVTIIEIPSIIPGPEGKGYKTGYTGRVNALGSSTYTVAANLAYSAGARIRAASTVNPATNYEEGIVTSYIGTTLIVAIDRSIGTTSATGNINIAGDVGGTGADSVVPGPAGPPSTLTGGVIMWPIAAVPSGYLLADGALVSRTTYAALFAVYGTTFGVGDGILTFKLPNMVGKFPFMKDTVGTGSTLGGTFGAKDHTHSTPAGVTGLATNTPVSVTLPLGSAAAPSHTHTIPAATTGLNNPPAFVVNFIIKT